MISLAPIKDTEKVKNIFAEKGFSNTEYSGCVAATCGEETLGLCLYELTKERITVLYIEPLEDIFLADGILRSTLHVAAENGVMNAFYEDSLPESFLKKIGFIKDEKEKILDIDKLFKSCCGCGEK